MTYNDEELKEKIGQEKFDKFVIARAEQFARLKTETSTDGKTS